MDGLPDFLVIGAARAGTTALHSYLGQHPGLFLPRIKEPNFFAYEGLPRDCRGPGAEFINNSLRDLDAYRALFAAAPAGAKRGEASPLYLWSDRAPGRIRAHVPGVRMIAILRNPVEQAFSHYLYARRHSIEPLDDFATALGQEEARLAAGWQPLFGYSAFPLYARQLERYFALFPREQFLIRTYDDWRADPEALIAEIFAFVGVDPGFRPDMSRKLNEGGQPKNAALQTFLMRPNPVTGLAGRLLPVAARRRIRDWLVGFNLKGGERLAPEAKAILVERLAPEIRRLEPLIGRDLSAWLA